MMERRHTLTRSRWCLNRQPGRWPWPAPDYGCCDGAPDNMRIGLLIFWGLIAASACGAATFQEDFSSNPLQNGWKIFGDTNLFQWDATNQDLAVTWDSSRTNSFFYHALGTILARDDNFHLDFDLMFQDYTNG